MDYYSRCAVWLSAQMQPLTVHSKCSLVATCPSTRCSPQIPHELPWRPLHPSVSWDGTVQALRRDIISLQCLSACDSLPNDTEISQDVTTVKPLSNIPGLMHSKKAHSVLTVRRHIFWISQLHAAQLPASHTDLFIAGGLCGAQPVSSRQGAEKFFATAGNI